MNALTGKGVDVEHTKSLRVEAKEGNTTPSCAVSYSRSEVASL